MIKKDPLSVMLLLQSSARMTPSGPNPSSKPPTPLPPLVSNLVSLVDHREKKRKGEKRHGKGVMEGGSRSASFRGHQSCSDNLPAVEKGHG